MKRTTFLHSAQVKEVFDCLQSLEDHGNTLLKGASPITRVHGFYIKAFIKELEEKVGL